MTFRYIKKDTVIERLNPITKIVLILLFILDAIMFRDITSMLIITVIVFSFLMLARVPRDYITGSVRILILAMGILLTVSQGFWYYWGEYVIFAIPGLGPAGEFTLDGVIFGITMSLKLVLVALSLPILTMTTPVNKFMAALSRLRVPYVFVCALTTAFKFTPLVTESYNEIREAQMMRGLDFKALSLLKRLRAYVSLSTPLVLSLVRKTDDMDVAIEARAFGSDTPRTFLVEVRFAARDLLVLAFSIAFFAFCVWGKLTWGALIPPGIVPDLFWTIR